MHISGRQLAEVPGADCVRHRARAVSFSRWSAAMVQALGELGLGALAECGIRGRAGFQFGVLLGGELLFQFPERVAGLGLGRAAGLSSVSRAVGVVGARDLADGALLRFPPARWGRRSSAPGQDVILSERSLDGYHFGYRTLCRNSCLT
jgi:hypothetical protein